VTRNRRGAAARRLGARAERLTLWLLWARGWDLVAWRQKLGRWELDLLVSRGPELRPLAVNARRPGARLAGDTDLQHEQAPPLQRGTRNRRRRGAWPRGDAITLGVTQGIIMVLAVVVIGGLVGSGGLGYLVAQGLQRGEFGLGVVASLAILALGIALDRVTQATRRAGRETFE